MGPRQSRGKRCATLANRWPVGTLVVSRDAAPPRISSRAGDPLFPGQEVAMALKREREHHPRNKRDNERKSAGGSTDLIDRVPPQNLEAEASVIGAILIDNDAAWVALQTLRAEHFYKSANERIFSAIVDLTRDRKPIDLVILRDELERRDELEGIGGTSYLRELVEVVPTARNIEHYAQLVHEKALLRSLIRVSTEIVHDAYQSAERAPVILDEAEARFFQVTGERVTSTVHDIETLMHEAFQKIDAGKPMTGLKCHLVDLDLKTNGLKPAELTILAARPSMGKTSLATTIMRNIAVQNRVGVAFYSLEMSADQVAQNLLCSHARVDSFRMRRGMLDQSEILRLQEAAGELADAPFYIDDATGMSVLELRAKARQLKQRHDIGLVVIDYLQLMEGDRTSGRSEGRQQEISQISRGLKALARELAVPVVALSQLSRAVEQREGHRPRLSDLRESGSLEQDADMVWLLFREAYYKPDKLEVQNTAELIVAKNRNGPVGSVPLFFHKEYTRFDNGPADR